MFSPSLVTDGNISPLRSSPSDEVLTVSEPSSPPSIHPLLLHLHTELRKHCQQTASSESLDETLSTLYLGFWSFIECVKCLK